MDDPRPIAFPDPPLKDGDIIVRGLVPADAEEFSNFARDPSISHETYHDRLDMEDLSVVRAFSWAWAGSGA